MNEPVEMWRVPVGVALTSAVYEVARRVVGRRVKGPLVFAALLGGCAAPSVAVVATPTNSGRNPIIYADVPDVAMIRVGDTYYMSSTTMRYTLPHFMGYRFGLFHYATKEPGGGTSISTTFASVVKGRRTVDASAARMVVTERNEPIAGGAQGERPDCPP